MSKIIGIIPARYQSSRFPGKPLAEINNRPMIWHVYNQAKKASLLDDVYVATDDFRIMDACDALNIKTIMTASHHPTGSDRVAEAARTLMADAVVNIQGDEPMISPILIDIIAGSVLKYCTDSCNAVNGYAKLENRADVGNPNTVKVIFDKDGNAIAFSRYPIPYEKGRTAVSYRQIGIYGFTYAGINLFGSFPQREIELAEEIEMYRFLENGYTIKMIGIPGDQSIPVDTPEDLEKVRNLMK